MFFRDGPGGTGKTFMYKLLLAHVQSGQAARSPDQQRVAVAVASSALAATLLPSGTIAHSFNIHIPVNQAPRAGEPTASKHGWRCPAFAVSINKSQGRPWSVAACIASVFARPPVRRPVHGRLPGQAPGLAVRSCCARPGPPPPPLRAHQECDVWRGTGHC